MAYQIEHVCGPDCEKLIQYGPTINLDHDAFFFVGCWNRLGFNNENACLDTNIENIRTSKLKYDFGLVLGDNIYPDEPKYDILKTKDKRLAKKPFTEKKMEDGIKKLESLGVPLQIVLGNHDIENCNILELQTRNHNYWTFRGNLYSTLYKVNGHNAFIKLIVIDTNVIENYNPDSVFEEKHDYDAEDYSKLMSDGCVLNDNIIINKKIYYDKFKQMLIPEHNKNVSLILIAGHQPLFSIKEKEKKEKKDKQKEKKETKKTKKSTMLFVDDLLTSVFELQKHNISVMYLCADTHAFMDSEVKNGVASIRQIVVGTGGTYPDVFTQEFIAEIKRKTPELGNVQLIVNTVNNVFGYCSFDVGAYFRNDMNYISYHSDENNTHNRMCFELPLGPQGPIDPLDPLKPIELIELEQEQNAGNYLQKMYFKSKRDYLKLCEHI